MAMFVSKRAVNGILPMVGSDGPRFLFGEGAAAVLEVNIV